MDAAQRSRIESLYVEMYDMLVAYVYGILKNPGLAEEVVQETFQIACRKPEEVCGSCNPKGWIFLTMRRTMRNLLFTRANTRRAMEQLLILVSAPKTDPQETANPAVLYSDLACSEDFKLLTDFSIQMKSYDQMAKERGISTATCRKRVQRAKEKFQKIL